MKLLILGGTVFLGRHIVDAALAQGDEVTILTRGIHNPDIFPGVEKLRGDRTGDLSILKGRRWDGVIDTSGYVPRIVGASVGVLADSVDHYAFVSSLSVYTSMSEPGMGENAPIAMLEDETVEEVTGETYGALKALCEQEVERAMAGRSASIRAGLIVGPHDPTDRFTYWVERVAAGGRVLTPGMPRQLVSFVDVRDLAEWTLRVSRERIAGTYNATGPSEPCTMGDLLTICREGTGSDAELVWADESFLAEHGVAPWQELPLWLPEDPENVGFNTVDCTRARAAGLTFRPVADTVAATLAWGRTRRFDIGARAGLTREREAELLRAWDSARD